jgi:hypothetical protein
MYGKRTRYVYIILAAFKEAHFILHSKPNAPGKYCCQQQQKSQQQQSKSLPSPPSFHAVITPYHIAGQTPPQKKLLVNVSLR